MKKIIEADLKACESCISGTCCYDGVEVTLPEKKRIEGSRPNVPGPWFRPLSAKEKSDEDHAFATVVRNGTCVFQGEKNLCQVYSLRPHYCREFPIENGATAPHYQHLCVIFHKNWAVTGSQQRTLLKRDGESPYFRQSGPKKN